MKKHISNFQYISDSLKDSSHAMLSELACRGGAKWVQLRVKNQVAYKWEKIAVEVQRVCAKYKATFIINDNVALAKNLDADGVHLGKKDVSISEARRILGPNKIIGGSANTIQDIIRLAKHQVDYIGLGPYKFTRTKNNLSPVLGLIKIQDIIKQANQCPDLSIPVIAIGGIKLEDVNQIMKTGIDGIAVSSAINHAPSQELASRSFAEKLNIYCNKKFYDNQPQYS